MIAAGSFRAGNTELDKQQLIVCQGVYVPFDDLGVFRQFAQQNGAFGVMARFIFFKAFILV